MYSLVERKKAIGLLNKGMKPEDVVEKLGYPSRLTLIRWYEQYLDDGRIVKFHPPRKRPRPREERVYTKRQKRRAVDHFFEHEENMARTVRMLGYPTISTLARWIDELEPGRRTPGRSGGSVSWQDKEKAVIDMLVRDRMPVVAVAAHLGVHPSSVYYWKKRLLGEEAPLKMRPKKKGMSVEELEAYREALESDIARLELKRDILEGTAKLLGKDRSVDPYRLTNREKTILIDSLRPTHRLKELLCALDMAKSSYLYQRARLHAPDKYADLRIRISEIFHDADARYGYRRIHVLLREEGRCVSEKVVCRIMRQEGLEAKRSKKRNYSSYAGEISQAPDNLVQRDFHAQAPNMLWLTDLTEFKVGRKKVYLSPIVDCFDGMVVSWTASTSPNAELVNSMLDAAAATLKEGEHPISHSDRGCHYRWPGWLKRCERYGIVRSMSQKGCSPDNSAMEGFFGRLKVEFFYGRDWSKHSTDEFIDELGEYIRWYNEDRVKVSLGGMSPKRYRESLGLAA